MSNNATDRLRELMDEMGVKWWAGTDERKTHWEANGLTWEYFNDGNGDAWLGFLGACESDITPEQAVAATVGAEDTYTREECEASFVRGYSLGCLPVGSDPQWDENRQTVDEHMAELGWVRRDAATLGRGTCHIECFDDGVDEGLDGEWFSYAEPTWYLSCNHTSQGTEPPKFCPVCGKEVTGK